MSVVKLALTLCLGFFVWYQSVDLILVPGHALLVQAFAGTCTTGIDVAIVGPEGGWRLSTNLFLTERRYTDFSVHPELVAPRTYIEFPSIVVISQGLCVYWVLCLLHPPAQKLRMVTGSLIVFVFCSIISGVQACGAVADLVQSRSVYTLSTGGQIRIPEVIDIFPIPVYLLKTLFYLSLVLLPCVLVVTNKGEKHSSETGLG